MDQMLLTAAMNKRKKRLVLGEQFKIGIQGQAVENNGKEWDPATPH